MEKLSVSTFGNELTFIRSQKVLIWGGVRGYM